MDGVLPAFGFTINLRVPPPNYLYVMQLPLYILHYRWLQLEAIAIFYNS